MKLEKIIQNSKEELPWSSDDFIRMHEQIMAKVSQTKIQKTSQSDKMKNYLRTHWRLWAQSSMLLSGLIALVVLSVDKEQFYVKSVAQMNNAKMRNEEILKIVQDNPEVLSSSVMVSAQDSEFFLDLAYRSKQKTN